MRLGIVYKVIGRSRSDSKVCHKKSHIVLLDNTGIVGYYYNNGVRGYYE
jgi:hypothetical protein